MKKLKIALDWTANTNHTGFYVAQKKGFYSALGLEVELITPDSDNYTVTPAKKVELGDADFALCPFESILSYRTKKTPFDAVAIAAIFREDISAIAALASSGIKSPQDLDGKHYASYKARYEDGIVRQMIKNDGGNGTFEITYPDKLGIWETLLKNKADATWVFRNWEGVQAKNEGIALNMFKMSDYGIPYGYSPVIMASKKQVIANKTYFSNFLEATKKGYLYAQEHPEFGIECIAPFVAEQDKNIDLLQSQKFTSPYYGDKDNWGTLEENKVEAYLNWIYEMGLEKTILPFKDLVFKIHT
ncbi:ABC transporter substrate-binding protein [Costertonia aggregata]|uniref:Thiamine pyrimidine synthase n=1 Tax=Costertonia aggregata TaxID=343403 RepID=A0A7H9AQE3_9FLAO|nr:ABC transporter substrate-binding protein [Costertonia aggregata]QLG45642.1 ABC transporter substrate-binding protein [Costertonia aggregata]